MKNVYRIVVPSDTYKDKKTGAEKTHWGEVGRLVAFQNDDKTIDGFILELHMFPNTKFKCFPLSDLKPPQVGGMVVEPE